MMKRPKVQIIFEQTVLSVPFKQNHGKKFKKQFRRRYLKVWTVKRYNIVLKQIICQEQVPVEEEIPFVGIG